MTTHLLRNIFWVVLILIIGCHGIYDSTRSFLAIKGLRKDLLQGKPIDHNAPWKNKNNHRPFPIRILFQ